MVHPDMVYIGQVEAVSDGTLAFNLRHGPRTKAAMDERITESTVSAVAQLPAVAAEAAALAQNDAGLVQRADLFGESTVTAPDYEHALADENGEATWVRFDERGAPPPSTVAALSDAGVVAVTPGTERGLRFQDRYGKDTWLGIDRKGMPDTVTKWAIVNTIRSYTGPDRPFVAPGNFVHWHRTDPDGNFIETLIGRN